MRPLATMRRTFVALVAAVSTMALATMVMPASGTVSAHTAFDYSLPTDGASVGNPVSEVIVAFTLPVTLVGNGFTAFDPQENVVEPFPVTDDNQVFRLQFDPPLAGGPVGVKYEVKAEDGHVLSGSFTFTVDAPVPTTTLPTTSVPPTTAPPSSAPATTAASAATATTAAAPTTDAVPNTSTDAIGGTIPPDDGDGGSSTGLIVVIAAAIAVGAVGFLLVRARTSGPA